MYHHGTTMPQSTAHEHLNRNARYSKDQAFHMDRKTRCHIYSSSTYTKGVACSTRLDSVGSAVSRFCAVVLSRGLTTIPQQQSPAGRAKALPEKGKYSTMSGGSPFYRTKRYPGRVRRMPTKHDVETGRSPSVCFVSIVFVSLFCFFMLGTLFIFNLLGDWFN